MLIKWNSVWYIVNTLNVLHCYSMSRARWKRQASSNQPPSSPCTWGWDQGSGLAETLAPPYASGKAHKHMVHPPSTAVSVTLSKTFSNRCQNMLTPNWHRLCWRAMAYTHASAHNVGAEVGRGGGSASREGEQDFSKFLLCKASLPSQFSIPAPTD